MKDGDMVSKISCDEKVSPLLPFRKAANPVRLSSKSALHFDPFHKSKPIVKKKVVVDNDQTLCPPVETTPQAPQVQAEPPVQEAAPALQAAPQPSTVLGQSVTTEPVTEMAVPEAQNAPINQPTAETVIVPSDSSSLGLIAGGLLGLVGLLAGSRSGQGSDAAAQIIPVVDVPAPATVKSQPVDVALSSQSDTGLKGDNVTNKSKPVLIGNAPAGSQVHLDLDTNNDGKIDFSFDTVADANGHWEVTPTSDLPDGSIQIFVTGMTADGQPLIPASLGILVDTAPPALSASLASTSDSGTAGDNLTNDNTPTLTGSADPGASVMVTILGQVTTVYADSQGKWSATLGNLPDGPYIATISTTDSAGNILNSEVALTVDTDASVKQVTLPYDVLSDLPSYVFNNYATTNPLQPISGMGAPGDRVTVTTPSGENLETTIAANGSWSVVPSIYSATPAGDQVFRVNVSDAAGNSSQSEVHLAYLAQETSQPVSDVGRTLSGWGDTSSNPAGDSTPSILGVATPYRIVMVLSPTGELLKTTAAQDGSWSVQVTQPLPQGNNIFKIAAGFELGVDPFVTDANGNVVFDPANPTEPLSPPYINGLPQANTPQSQTYIVDTVRPNSPTIEILQDGNNDGCINASEAVTGLALIRVNFEVGPEQINNFITLYAADGTTVLGERQLNSTDASLGFVFFDSIPLPPEGSTLTVLAKLADFAGNVDASWTTASRPSDTAKVDTTTPTLSIVETQGIDAFTGQIYLDITVSKSTNTLTVADLILTGYDLIEFTGSGTSYHATLIPNASSILPDGSYTEWAINANSFSDLCGNLSVDNYGNISATYY
jgi:Bacterial Ig-like domain/Bacterial Ig domain